MDILSGAPSMTLRGRVVAYWGLFAIAGWLGSAVSIAWLASMRRSMLQYTDVAAIFAPPVVGYVAMFWTRMLWFGQRIRRAKANWRRGPHVRTRFADARDGLVELRGRVRSQSHRTIAAIAHDPVQYYQVRATGYRNGYATGSERLCWDHPERFSVSIGSNACEFDDGSAVIEFPADALDLVDLVNTSNGTFCIDSGDDVLVRCEVRSGSSDASGHETGYRHAPGIASIVMSGGQNPAIAPASLRADAKHVERRGRYLLTPLRSLYAIAPCLGTAAWVSHGIAHRSWDEILPALIFGGIFSCLGGVATWRAL